MSQAGQQGQPYDPELPFLAALEREVRDLAEQRAGGTSRPTGTVRPPRLGAPRLGAPRLGASLRERGEHGPAPAAGTGAGRVHRNSRARLGLATNGRRAYSAPMRVARRSLTLVALLCLIGASAFGARRIFFDPEQSPLDVRHGSLLEVAHGRSGTDSWTLSLYERGGELCRVLTVAEVESSRCADPPGRDAIGITSTTSPMHRYEFGVTGADIAQVRLRMGSVTRIVHTRMPEPAGAHSVGLPRGARFYVAVFTRPPSKVGAPVLVRPLDSAGRSVGAELADCGEAPVFRGCAD